MGSCSMHRRRRGLSWTSTGPESKLWAPPMLCSFERPQAPPIPYQYLRSVHRALDLADVPDAELPSGERERSSESSTSRFSGSVKRMVGTSASALREYSGERQLGHLWRTHADSTSGLRANRPPCAAALPLGSP